MSLYSSGTQTNAGGKIEFEPKMELGPKDIFLSSHGGSDLWAYMFIHHKKVDIVNERLKTRFTTFIHKQTVYVRQNNKVHKDEKQTISGLLFVQGDRKEIQEFLNENFVGLHLVKDRTKGTVAQITDAEMRPFMKVAQVEPTRIRFMPKAFSHYAEGNPLLRITSGPLAGMEGYKIRIARDKCFVTTLGGMTVAIGGIHRDSFENLEDAPEGVMG